MVQVGGMPAVNRMRKVWDMHPNTIDVLTLFVTKALTHTRCYAGVPAGIISHEQPVVQVAHPPLWVKGIATTL